MPAARRRVHGVGRPRDRPPRVPRAGDRGPPGRRARVHPRGVRRPGVRPPGRLGGGRRHHQPGEAGRHRVPAGGRRSRRRSRRRPPARSGRRPGAAVVVRLDVGRPARTGLPSGAQHPPRAPPTPRPRGRSRRWAGASWRRSCARWSSTAARPAASSACRRERRDAGVAPPRRRVTLHSWQAVRIVPLPRRAHPERHLSGRSNWLRAAVLGANDGLVSVSSLLLGVVAGGASHSATLVAGFAGLAAGALSMAAGEYVSVSSQRDAENADLDLERRELRADPEGELEELAGIYSAGGSPPSWRTASRGRSPRGTPSAPTPATSWAWRRSGWRARGRRPGRRRSRSPRGRRSPSRRPPSRGARRCGWRWSWASRSSRSRASARSAPTLGGAPRWPAVARVTLWGAAAMGLTAAVGSLVGAAV